MNGGATMAALPAADQSLCDDVAAASGERQRRAVAKAITLLESTRADHRRRADALLAALPVPAEPALRVGISGVPGVGKSTFIETLGLELIAQGHRVAVLAVDPSSQPFRRLDPRRQDADGAALGRTSARSSGPARAAARSAASPRRRARRSGWSRRPATTW